jgi:sentrin-specific protease 1
MDLLKGYGKLENYPAVYTINIFFYPRLLSVGHTPLKMWPHKVDIFSHDLITIPVHLGVHWCLAAIDVQNKTVKYYYSLSSPNHKCLQILMKCLQDESLDKKKTSFVMFGWQTENVQKIPQQMNKNDCGIFACIFAEYICHGADISFIQQDIPYFWCKMVYEIYTCKIFT